MAKNALIILAEGFEEIEAVTVIDVLRRAQIQISVCAMENLSVTGSRNIRIQADIKLEEFNDDFYALILPGGTKGAQNLSKSQIVGQIIRKAYKENKLIAAICAAPALVLSPLGVLDGKTATCFPGMEEYFSDKTKFSRERVVQDGNIITSQGPATAIDFALKIVENLTDKDAARAVKNKLLA